MNPLDGVQSALNPFGPDAATAAELAWILFAGGAAVFALVIALAVLAIRARPKWLAQRGTVIAGGIIFPAVVVAALHVYTLVANAKLTDSRTPPALRVTVVAEQFWWRVHYLDANGKEDFTTANEIRLPVGATVEFNLRSADVLHSFWVPALGGKLDFIPGKDNRLQVKAERPGTFRGQCAEYCGTAHAQMAFYVIAEAPADFDAWREAQRQPQRGAPGDQAVQGREIFLANCSVCHTVRGTSAQGRLGPDLTHFASRVSMAAGILPVNTGSVAAWIVSSQDIKPGNLMPEFRRFSGSELSALATYVTNLR